MYFATFKKEHGEFSEINMVLDGLTHNINISIEQQ